MAEGSVPQKYIRAVSSFYIDVVVPLALRGAFTYEVPDELIEEMIPGKRVVVPFGAKRFYAAVIINIDTTANKGHRPKLVSYVLDSEPILLSTQLDLWRWISKYYMSGLGSVMQSALPGAMRLTSQTSVILSERELPIDELTEFDHVMLANLSEKKLVPVQVLEKMAGKSMVQRSLDRLIKLGIIEVQETINEQIKPRVKVMLQLEGAYHSEKDMSSLLEELGRAPKQLEVVMKFLELSNYFNGTAALVERKRLMNMSGASSAIVSSLVKKEVFSIVEINDDFNEVSNVEEGYNLNEQQSSAYKSIVDSWASQSTVVLHGVTGSGKTLLYAKAINEQLANGGQALLLVPEIALTTQLVARLKHMLNDDLIVYHSRFSNRERLTMWMQLLSESPPKVIVGARSSVFLPFKDLKLIVVDEEHEVSYKQHEHAPFYNAKDTALWLAKEYNAKVLLGSATPTVQTYYTSESGKFSLVELSSRYGELKMPDIQWVDLKKSLKDKKMKADFAEETFEEISKTLKEKRQVIVFQNRRGYAPYQMCQSCGWSAECINCDVNLTVHKYFKKLLCHYCGHSLNQPSHCPQCGSAKLVVKGVGTEKIEDDAEILFPDALIARMDLDTTRSKNALENIIVAFEEGSYDILIGTQMVTKGLDFENVGLVVVMNADSLWSRPDFRSFERAYQLLTQVAGRAGRKNNRGKVLIQTYNPDHPVLEFVKDNNYKGLFENQLAERREFDYPPFSKMIRIQLSHGDAKLTKEAANYFASSLKPHFAHRLLGPEEPPIARIRNRFLRQMFVKLETNLSAQKSRNLIWQAVDLIEGHADFKKVRVQIDVDPL